MSKKILFLVGMVALLAFAAPTFAQTRGDRDGDGIPDELDRCPDQAGPRDNFGCPILEENAGIPDRDGDGVADFVDLCPDEAGTGFTEGCPDVAAPEVTLVAEPASPQVVMIWQSMDECMVGVPLTSSTNVNIREQPTVNSAAIGQLAPGDQFAPFFRDYDENNAVWFGGAPSGTPPGGGDWGWVAGSAVIDNGQCVNLPMVIHVDAPYQLQIELLPDADAQSYSAAGEQTYLVIELENVQITSYQLGVLDDPIVARLKLLSEDGSPLPDAGDFDPLLLVKSVDPNAPEEDCAAIGEGFCLLAGLLLPAFGDEPGQCPPETFIGGLQAAFPGAAADFDGDGDVDGRDFLMWQRNPGDLSELSLLLPANDPAAGEGRNDQIDLLSYSFGDGSAIGLLLPAIQAAREAATHSGEPKPGFTLDFERGGNEIQTEAITIVHEGFDIKGPCLMVGFVPHTTGGMTVGMGDGSVRFVSNSVALLLPYIEQDN